MTALAVMVALLGAMFAVLQSVNAQTVTNLGDCGMAAGVTNSIKINDTCEIPSGELSQDDALSVSNSAVVSLSGGGAAGDPEATPAQNPNHWIADGNGVTVTAKGLGTATVTNHQDSLDDASDDVTYVIEVLPAASLTVTFKDSDSTVKAGTEVTVVITAKAVAATGSSLSGVLSVPSTGLFFVDFDNTPDNFETSQRVGFTISALGPTAQTTQATLSTTGAQDGQYLVTATTTAEVGNLKKGSVTGKLIIGDAGAGLASATIGLADGEKGSVGAPGSITLDVEAFNSLGSKSNAGDVNQVTVIAPGGDVTIPASGDATGVSDRPNSGQIEETTEAQNADGDANDDEDDDVGQKTTATISKDTPGQVTVYALLIGASGTARTEDFVLTFTGPAETISLGDASDQLAQKADSITFEVAAADTAGNGAAVSAGSVTATVVDADDKAPANLSATVTQKVDNKGTEDDETDDEDVPTAVVVTVTSGSTSDANAKAERGVYTVKVTLNGLEETEMTGDFTVVGGPAKVDVTADPAGGENFGDVITITAMITDEDGNAVDDETLVNFANSQDTGLSQIGAAHTGVKTKDGSASVKYAVVGAGISVVSATTQVGGVSGVVVVRSTAGMVEQEAMPEEEASVACLSNLNGFSTWSCGVESSASEIFDLVSGRGATALHLWNGTAWVRYSVVDGTMVPGSSDFMVAENDILYISN